MGFRPALAALTAALLLAGVAGCGSSGSSSNSSSSSGASAQPSPTQTQTQSQGAPASQTQMGFEGVPIEPGPELASAGTTGRKPVDGIKCAPSEQLAYHIHVHLAVYDNGGPRSLPGGIGIPGSQIVQTSQGPVAAGGHCIYWLHTHAPDGIIHVESPTFRVYTLGQFFNIWRQPLSSNQVAGAKGPVSVLVNGKPWTKNPRSIPLIPHYVIQMSVGDPVVPYHPMSWVGLRL